jgi:hypothetical protein
MESNVESANARLSHLQDIHADLNRKVAALASLRKQVQEREAALHAERAARNQLRRMLATKAAEPCHL